MAFSCNRQSVGVEMEPLPEPANAAHEQYRASISPDRRRISPPESGFTRLVHAVCSVGGQTWNPDASDTNPIAGRRSVRDTAQEN
jgi:hypothetical protein